METGVQLHTFDALPPKNRSLLHDI